jgi:hypothetical protein
MPRGIGNRKSTAFRGRKAVVFNDSRITRHVGTPDHGRMYGTGRSDEFDRAHNSIAAVSTFSGATNRGRGHPIVTYGSLVGFQLSGSFLSRRHGASFVRDKQVMHIIGMLFLD